jgi:hypothetical protein
MVGDLRMWLYRATPGNPRHYAGADHYLNRQPHARVAPSCLRVAARLSH